MTQPESQQIRALRTIEKSVAERAPKDFVQNLVNLNQATKYLTQMMIVTQKGVDQANKDIIAQIQDAINELIILFSGGGGSFDFDWGDLTVVIENLSAILGIPDFTEGVDLAGWAENFINDIVTNPLGAVVINFINDMVADLLDAIDGATGSIFNLDDLADSLRLTEDTAVVANDTATNAQITANNAQAQIQELVNDSNGEETGGVTITRLFNSSENGAGITNFTVAPSGKIGVLGGVARWYLTGTSGSTGEGHANHNTDSTVDDMENSVTFGTNHSEIAYSGCYIRANSGMTYAWGIRVYFDQVQIGYISGWNGTSYTWNQVSQIIRDSYNGDVYRVRAVGDLYTVYANNYPIYNATNAARPKGASYRDHGMWFGRAVNFGFYQSGAGVLQYAFAELLPLVTTGVGWDFFRSTTSATSSLPGDYSPININVFDTNRRSSGVTVSNYQQGRVVILTPGWYMCSSNYRMNRGADDYPPGERALLYYTRGGSEVLADVRPHNPALSTARDVGGIFLNYFEINDIVYPGFYYDKVGLDAASTMVGDTLGTVTYFKGVLMNNRAQAG